MVSAKFSEEKCDQHHTTDRSPDIPDHTGRNETETASNSERDQENPKFLDSLGQILSLPSNASERAAAATSASEQSIHVTNNAEAVVREAAKRIGFTGEGIDLVCAKLHDEFVMEPWQLSHIDSFQWRDLAAPIGLVAAIRQHVGEAGLSFPCSQTAAERTVDPSLLTFNHSRQLSTGKGISTSVGKQTTVAGDKIVVDIQPTNEKTNDGHLVDPEMAGANIADNRAGFISSLRRAPHHLRRTFTTEHRPQGEFYMTACEERFSNDNNLNSDNKEVSWIGEPVDEEAGRDKNAGGVHPSVASTPHASENDKSTFGNGMPLELPGLMARIRALLKVSQLIDWIIPFDHQPMWKRGLLHAMPSSYLQWIIINASELWFVFLALFFGGFVSLWDAYPDTGDDASLGVVALVFNSVMCLAATCCIVGVGMFGVVYVVSSAVSPSHFKRFCLMAMPAIQAPEIFLMASAYLLMLLLILCMHARNTLAATNSGIEVNVAAITGGMAVALLAIVVWGFFNMNLLGRVAFHGGFLAEEDRRKERHSIAASRLRARSPLEFECMETRKALDNLKGSGDEVLRGYMRELSTRDLSKDTVVMM